MDYSFDKEEPTLRRQVHAWVKSNLGAGEDGPLNLESEACRLAKRLGQDGLMAYVVPGKFGGVRETISARDLCVIREELAWGSALADVMFGVQALGSYPIALAGSEEQQRHYLPPLAKGEKLAAFALTEPNAGSDVSAISTRALRDTNGYRLNGVKHFISNAGIAHTYVVFASTQPETKAKGLSAFIVESDSAGFSVKEKTPLLSPHPLGALAFDDCFVPQHRRLGGEGEGLKIALHTLDTLRCTVGAAAVGFARRALEEAVAYSRNRRQFGRALADFQGIQFKLADMATELEGARLLVDQAASMKDHHHQEAPVKVSMAKLFATEAAQRIVDQSLQIHGANGVIAGNILERLYRDVRALRIYEGTSEIQRLIISKHLLKGEQPDGL
jgi:acyl-CoA dehydrogenase